MFGSSGILHPSAPHNSFWSGDYYGVPVIVQVLDLPVILSDDKKTGMNHVQNLLLGRHAIQRIGNDKIVRPNTIGFEGTYPHCNSMSEAPRLLTCVAESAARTRSLPGCMPLGHYEICWQAPA